MAFTKSECPISREAFRRDAPRTMAVTINGVHMGATYKEFKTGSFGWFLSGKVTVPVNGASVQVQVGLNLTCIGSKELPQ